MKKKRNETRRIQQMRWGGILGVTISLVLLFSTSGQAIWLGQTQVNPFIEVSGAYETNEFRVSDAVSEGEDSDFITVISPGVHFEMPTYEDSMYQASANYRMNMKLYGNHGDEEIDPNEELNTLEHRFNSELAFNFASGFKMKGGYKLDILSDAPDYRQNTRDDYTDHFFFTRAGYAFADRYEVQLGYEGTMTRYSDNESADKTIHDKTIHGVEAVAFYRILPKLSILGGGGYAMVDRQDEPGYSDSTEYTGFTGAKYEMTERTTGEIRVGATSKSFDSDEEIFEDTTEFFLSGQMHFEQSEMTTITASIFREFINSTTYGGYYISTGAEAKVSHSLAALPNLTLSGSFEYSNDDYPDDDDDLERSENNIDVGLELDYTFAKYITTGAVYQYSTTDSDDNANDFVNHTAKIRVQFML